MDPETEKLLKNNNLSEYISVFKHNRIGIAAIEDLSSASLSELIEPLGDRLRFLKAFEKVKITLDRESVLESNSPVDSVAAEIVKKTRDARITENPINSGNCISKNRTPHETLKLKGDEYSSTYSRLIYDHMNSDIDEDVQSDENAQSYEDVIDKSKLKRRRLNSDLSSPESKSSKTLTAANNSIEIPATEPLAVRTSNLKCPSSQDSCIIKPANHPTLDAPSRCSLRKEGFSNNFERNHPSTSKLLDGSPKNQFPTNIIRNAQDLWEYLESCTDGQAVLKVFNENEEKLTDFARATLVAVVVDKLLTDHHKTLTNCHFEAAANCCFEPVA